MTSPLENVEWLTAAIAAYEMDAPHTGQFAVPTHYPLLDVEVWKLRLAQTHSGDCTNQPHPCARCAAEEYRHFAEWLIEKAKEST
jgi:hypothetical protein